jgi:hypothetical protein
MAVSQVHIKDIYVKFWHVTREEAQAIWHFRDTPTLVNVFPDQVTKFPNLGHDTVFHKL